MSGETCHLALETEPGGFFVCAFRKGKPVAPDGAGVVACFARGWRRRTRRSCGAHRWDGVGLQRAGDADEAVLRSVPLGWRGVATRRGCGRGDPAERTAWAHRVVVCRAQWASRLDGGYWRAVGEGRAVCARMAKARPAFGGRFGTCPRAGCASSASAVGRVYRVNTRFAMVKSMVSEAASTMVVMIGLAISAGSR